MGKFVDYYSILGVDPSAETEEIRKAYMKKAIVEHPDRSLKPDATEIFQHLADAYYVLTDKHKRKEYDEKYKKHMSDPDLEYQPPEGGEGRKADYVFGDVFEKILKKEVEKEGYVWRNLGMVSGGVMGYIFANIPGAIGGAFAGRTLGKIRDRKGKAVIEVFNEMPIDKRLVVLSAVAAKVLASV